MRFGGKSWVTNFAVLLCIFTAFSCGGFGGGGSTPIPGYPTKEVILHLELPASLPANSLSLFAANTQLIRPPVDAKIRVGSASPTVVLIADAATNSIVGLTVADPRLTAPTVDTKSFAGAILYLGVGASQLSTEDRIALWDLILSHSSTTGLAAMLNTKLAANRFAYRDADADLKLAIKNAIAAVRADMSSARTSKLAVRDTKTKTREVPSPADPPVLYTIPETSLSGFGQVLSGKVNGKAYPDFIEISETTLRSPERVAYLVPEATSGGRISDTFQLPEVRGFTEQVVGPVSSPTNSTNPANIDYVAIHPVFDAPDASVSGFVDDADWAIMDSARKLLWKKAVVRFSSDIILETLGFGGAEMSPDQLAALTNAFENINTEFRAIIQASADGKDLAGHVESFVTNASSSDDQIRATYTVLKTIVPDLHFLTPERLVIVRAALLTAVNQQIVNGLGEDGPLALAYQYNGENPSLYSNLLALKSSGLKFQKYSPTIDTTATTYTPGGSPIQLNVRSTGNDYISKFSDVLIFKWKVFGSGGTTLTAGSQSGTEFETSQPNVIFQSTSAAAGAQNVGVEVYLKNGNGKRLYGKSTIILNDTAGGNVVLGGGGVTQFGINLAGSLSVSRNGQTITSWPGVNAANLRFEWTLSNSDAGTYVSNGVPTTSITTTTGTVPFKSADMAHGTENTASVVIKAVDPGTGNFTVLASASSIVRLHIFSNCRVSLLPSFSPSQLENDVLVRNGTNIGTNSISFSGGHYFANGSFSNTGARDKFSNSIDLGTSPSVGDVFTVPVSGSTSFIQHTYYFNVLPFVAINNAACTAEIMEIRTNSNGTPRYVRLKITSNWQTSTNTMAIESNIDAGYGTY